MLPYLAYDTHTPHPIYNLSNPLEGLQGYGPNAGKWD